MEKNIMPSSLDINSNVLSENLEKKTHKKKPVKLDIFQVGCGKSPYSNTSI